MPSRPTGRLGGVGRPGEGLAIDYQVVTDIRTFEVRVFGDRLATVEISVRVLNRPQWRRPGATGFPGPPCPLTGTSNEAYVAALDLAQSALTAELVTLGACGHLSADTLSIQFMESRV